MASPPAGCIEIEQVFIGAGCNRIVNNVSWAPLGLVSFGAHNAVAIFDPETAQICCTLPGHKAAVNCTQWLPSTKDAVKVPITERLYLISGGADGVIILWELTVKERKWRQMLQIPESHKKGVTCITGIMLTQEVALFASTSSDCSVLIWEIIFPDHAGGECIVSQLDSISVGPRPMVTLSFSELRGNGGLVFLAMGGLDHKIHLFCRDGTKKLNRVCELKGHTDWIRSLDFSFPIDPDSGGADVFLVSSSQDRSIRIWKLALLSSSGSNVPYKREDVGLKSYIEGPVFSAGSSIYQMSLESLLIGHEDWVYSVEWHPPLPKPNSKSRYFQPLSILSASMDKTMMIWRQEKTTGIWVNMTTVGEISHCALGFYGGHWSPSGDSILAHGYGGAFHLWKNISDDGDENWQPRNVPSGHFAAVSDIEWARSGHYLLSVSHDQTTRAFAPWYGLDTESASGWHEIARPQVHGHDINCLAVIQGKGNQRFISGADEKVGRVFEAPLSFLRTLKHADSLWSSDLEDMQEGVHVLGANMSALGLSQKPIFDHSTSNGATTGVGFDASDSLEYIPDALPTVFTKPPVEERLSWHTLWPETHKLYGHGNELFSVCCDHKGRLVASSCKAQSTTVAEIWLWEVGSWRAVGRLHSHSLTVTRMEFSLDDNLLVAVSRDRHFSVFSISISDTGEVSHQLLARLEGHKRIIWACSWNPYSHEFATGSRDKTVKIWGVNNSSSPSVKQLLTLPLFGSSITALSWLGRDRVQNEGLLAIGMESGSIEFWSISGGSKHTCAPMTRLDLFLCHTSSVNRLKWRSSDAEDSRATQLASCGADNCVRVFEVRW